MQWCINLCQIRFIESPKAYVVTTVLLLKEVYNRDFHSHSNYHYVSVKEHYIYQAKFSENVSLETMQSWILGFLPTGTRKPHERSKNINVRMPAKCILCFDGSV